MKQTNFLVNLMFMASCSQSGDLTVNTADGSSKVDNPRRPDVNGQKLRPIDPNPREMMLTESFFSSGIKVWLGVLGNDPALKHKVQIVMVSCDPSAAAKVLNCA